MSRVEIDAGGRKVVVDHEGELAHLAETASKLWADTAGVEPARLGGAVGFMTQPRNHAPVTPSTLRYGPARIDAGGGQDG